ncbi:MAG: helix-turn-helix domain-containing protein [Thermodesulfobacteriota bacterium]
MEAITKKIAQVIRERRKRVGLSQEELAEKADIDRTYVSLIERGKVNMTVVVVAKIAKALGVSLSSIIKKIE